MRKISLVLQEVLKISLLFLLTFVWIRYFVRKFWLALMLSVLISAAAYAAYVFLVRKKRSKNTLRLKEKEDAENMFLSLALDNHPMEFFAKLAAQKHENVQKHKEYLVITYPSQEKNGFDAKFANKTATKSAITNKKITNKTITNRTITNKKITNRKITNRTNRTMINKTISENAIENNTTSTTAKDKTSSKVTTNNAVTVLFADFSFEGLTVSRFMQIYNKVKKEKPTKIVVVCKSVDKTLPAFVANFSEKILLLDEYQTYQSLYKLYGVFPEITHRYAPAKKMAFKDFMAFSFNKSRTKAYLFSALVLIISGVFIRPTIYYCIVASLLVVFALISQFNPYFNKTPSQEVL